MSEQTNVHGADLRFEGLPADIQGLLTAAILSDSLDASGVRGQVMVASITALQPGARVAGRARTVQFAPTETDPDDPYGAAMDFIDGLSPGTVPVIATGEDERTAYWGELFSAAAKGHGAVGTVCDGPVRDVPKVRALRYDVFARASRPLDFRGRMRIVSAGEPVCCGGVRVAPDDLVFADEDGVVVVPHALEAEALRLAVERATTEQSVLEELLDGSSLRQVWERWHVL
jgi:regulator of RNase E activity RraA